MKNADAKKTEPIPKSTLLFFVDLLHTERVNRSANPDRFTASPIIKEPIINHTTFSDSDSYNNSVPAAFIMMINIISVIATNPAGILVVIHSVIADKNANNAIFPLKSK